MEYSYASKSVLSNSSMTPTNFSDLGIDGHASSAKYEWTCVVLTA